MAKKLKKDPIKHEQEYIEYLEKQIEWNKKQSNESKVKELKYTLDKAKLILKLLSSKK